MRRLLQWTLALCCVAGGLASAHADSEADARKQLAMEVPIADMHMHVYPGLTPQETLARMDRNKVRWGGGVGPVRPGVQVADFVALLGPRYVPAGAQPDYAAIYHRGGAAEMVDAQSPSFVALLAKMENDLKDKKIQGLGELILNNRSTHPSPQFRRKMPIQAPTFSALVALADKYDGFVQIHMEDDADSTEGLEELARRHPKLPFIMSHCFGNATASSAKTLLEKHANLYCETSARSSAILTAPSVQRYHIHDQHRAQSAWVALMEAMPDRFMVGSDDNGSTDYDTIIKTVRTGLLPYLSEPTMKKVAYENAQRVFKLPPIP